VRTPPPVPPSSTSPSSSRRIIIQPFISGANEILQRVPGEVAVLVVDRLEAGSVHGQQLAAKVVEPPAQQHELLEHRSESGEIVAPKVGDGLEVRPQASQQPDYLDVAMAFHLQPAARPHLFR